MDCIRILKRNNVLWKQAFLREIEAKRHARTGEALAVSHRIIRGFCRLAQTNYLRRIVRPLGKNMTIVLFLLPTFSILFLVMVYPLFMGISMSVSEIDLSTFTLTFKGFQNYGKIFSEPEFWRTVRNSLIWVAGITIFQFVIGFAAALLLNMDIPGISVFRVILILPWTIPIVVVAFNFFWLYHIGTNLFQISLIL